MNTAKIVPKYGIPRSVRFSMMIKENNFNLKSSIQR